MREASTVQAKEATLREERILVLACEERDAQAISSAVAEGGYAEIAPDMAQLCAAVREGAGAVVLVDAGASPPTSMSSGRCCSR
jgi:hypothetical protein